MDDVAPFVAASDMAYAAARASHLPPGSPRRFGPPWIRRVVQVVAACALLVIGSLFAREYWQTYQLHRVKAELIRERDELLRQRAQAREEIRLLNTPEYIERIAREQLGLVRPGEIAIMLAPPTPAQAPIMRPPAQPGHSEERQGGSWLWLLLVRLWQSLGG